MHRRPSARSTHLPSFQRLTWGSRARTAATASSVPRRALGTSPSATLLVTKAGVGDAIEKYHVLVVEGFFGVKGENASDALCELSDPEHSELFNGLDHHGFTSEVLLQVSSADATAVDEDSRHATTTVMLAGVNELLTMGWDRILVVAYNKFAKCRQHVVLTEAADHARYILDAAFTAALVHPALEGYAAADVATIIAFHNAGAASWRECSGRRGLEIGKPAILKTSRVVQGVGVDGAFGAIQAHFVSEVTVVPQWHRSVMYRAARRANARLSDDEPFATL
ncbi:hypothetical protein T492DRAFT_1147842 [Pavlovales sp. CCMP2436]|nr:hypothetical protein T492DRAFT_1147842 [Pavlovales sp. CCMP2436]